MRIYRLDYNDDESNRVEWYANKKDAEKALAGIKKEYAEGIEEERRKEVYQVLSDGNLESYKITLEDFPTRKADVITWLNIYLNTANG